MKVMPNLMADKKANNLFEEKYADEMNYIA